MVYAVASETKSLLMDISHYNIDACGNKWDGKESDKLIALCMSVAKEF